MRQIDTAGAAKRRIFKIRLRIPRALRKLARAYKASGSRLYLVGGWVRDVLVNKRVYDFDIAGPLQYDAVEKLFMGMPGVSLATRSAALGTFAVTLREGKKNHVFEYTPFRGERYAPGGAHRPLQVSFGVDMRQDALRRDFTANALYADVLSGRVYDPLGGLEDLKKGILRTCRAPVATFGEDGLRLMRLARFAGAYGWAVGEDTLRVARQAACLMEDIAPQRVFDELCRILCPKGEWSLPDMRVLRALELLWETGVLEVIMPEFAVCAGFGQNPVYHRHDVLRHSFHACAWAKPVPALRLAALLHDIGKPATWEKQGNMLGHEKESAEKARNILARLKAPKRLAGQVCGLVANHMYAVDGQTSATKLRRFFVRLGRENAQLFIDLRRADALGSKDEEHGDPAYRMQKLLDEMLADGTPFTLGEMDIDGSILQNAFARPPGPWVGEILGELQAWCVEHPGKNQRELLIKRAAGLLERKNAHEKKQQSKA